VTPSRCYFYISKHHHHQHHSTGEEHSSVDKDGDISMSCGLDVDEDISMVAFFDHEEVGSDSNSGAGSTIMRDAVVR
jgi:hypothetical protein